MKSIRVSVDDNFHRDFKAWCAQNGLTIKAGVVGALQEMMEQEKTKRVRRLETVLACCVGALERVFNGFGSRWPDDYYIEAQDALADGWKLLQENADARPATSQARGPSNA